MFNTLNVLASYTKMQLYTHFYMIKSYEGNGFRGWIICAKQKIYIIKPHFDIFKVLMCPMFDKHFLD
jgi:hypothetical protein